MNRPRLTPALGILAAAIVLPGCATKPDLKTPGDRLTTISIENRVPKAKFTAFSYEDDYDCFGWRQLVPEQRDFSHGAYSIPQKEYQSIGFSYSYVSGAELLTCGVVATFKTVTGAAYLVRASQHFNGCSIAVFDKTTGSPIEHPFESRQKKRPLYDAGGPWCSPNERYTGSSNYVKPRSASD